MKEKERKGGLAWRIASSSPNHRPPLKPVSGWAPPRVVYIAPVGPLAKQYRLWSRYLCTPRADRCLCTNRSFFFLFGFLFFFFRWKRIPFPWTGEEQQRAECEWYVNRSVLVCENCVKSDKRRGKDNLKNDNFGGKVFVRQLGHVYVTNSLLCTLGENEDCVLKRKDYQKEMIYHRCSSDWHR